MEKRYLTVSALNRYIKAKIDQDTQLQKILIKGEISNFKRHGSGHLYFTLKDENSRINAVMFSSKASLVLFKIEDGMKVLIEASVSVYDIAGTYQIYVNTIEQDGIGNLFLQFEMLKKTLSNEGLFDIGLKKEIPSFPSKIAILTANKSAALMDMIRTIKLRFPVVRVIVFPIPVQGKDAYKEIVKTLKYVDTLMFDTIIIGRGGGSLEDLWNFNEELLARTIFECKTPIISGVGHEVDFTICDFVADYRAATPTAAASKATPDLLELKQNISNTRYTLHSLIKQKININKQILHKYKSFYLFKNPSKIFEDKKARLDYYNDQLLNNFNNGLHLKRTHTNQLIQSFNHKVDLFKIMQQNKIASLEKELYTLYELKYKQQLDKFHHLVAQLDTLSPLKTLDRGYAIILKDNKATSSQTELISGDKIEIKLRDGQVKAVVE